MFRRHIGNNGLKQRRKKKCTVKFGINANHLNVMHFRLDLYDLTSHMGTVHMLISMAPVQQFKSFLDWKGKEIKKLSIIIIIWIVARFAIHLSWILLYRARFRTAKTFFWSDRVHLQKHRVFSETFSISMKEKIHIHQSEKKNGFFLSLSRASQHLSNPFNSSFSDDKSKFKTRRKNIT